MIQTSSAVSLQMLAPHKHVRPKKGCTLVSLLSRFFSLVFFVSSHSLSKAPPCCFALAGGTRFHNDNHDCMRNCSFALASAPLLPWHPLHAHAQLQSAKALASQHSKRAHALFACARFMEYSAEVVSTQKTHNVHARFAERQSRERHYYCYY